MIKLNEIKKLIPVYRGQDPKYKTLPKSVWVTENEDFAKEYGNVKKYYISTSLNLLDVDSTEGDELAEEFDADPLDIYYEPNNKFINFLYKKGFGGFTNEENILIFNNKNVYDKIK